jgi:hypothetical protein
MKITFFLLLAVVLFGCKQKNEYKINGSFKEKTTEGWIYMSKFLGDNSTLDSAKIENGHFTFKGTIDFPDVYLLMNHPQRSSESLLFFNEPTKININIGLKNWGDSSTIEGGKINKEYRRLEREYFNIMQENAKDFSKKSFTEQLKLYGQKSEQREKIRIEKINYIKTHPESLISVFYFLNIYQTFSVDSIGETLSTFSPGIKQTAIYQYISEYYNTQIPLVNSTPCISNFSEIRKSDADFKGEPVIPTLVKLHSNKVLYITVWSPLCDHCFQEFSFARKLSETIDTSKVSLIYLCVNTKADKWEKIIENEALKGSHYLLGAENLKQLYNEIDGNSEYTIVNSKGDIVYPSAPYPSSKRTIELLTNLSK